jgi:WD40 repeat protein
MESGRLYAYQFTPDSRYLYGDNGNGDYYLWYLGNWRQIAFPSRTAPRFSSDGRYAFTQDQAPDYTVHLWNMSAGDGIPRELLSQPRATVTFSPDSRWWASWSDIDQYVHVWETDTGHERLKFELPGDYPTLLFNPTGDALYVKQGSHIQFLAVPSGDKATAPPVDDECCYEDRDTQFLADGRLAAYRGQENTLILWDIARHQVANTFPAYIFVDNTDAYNLGPSFQFSPDSQYFAHRLRDRRIALRDLKNGSEIVIAAPGGMMHFSQDSRVLIVHVEHDQGISLWDVASGKLLAQEDIGRIFAESQTTLAVMDYGQLGLTLWNIQSGERSRSLPLIRSMYSLYAQFSSDGSILATQYKAGLQVWDVDMQKERLHIETPDIRLIRNLIFTTDNSALIITGENTERKNTQLMDAQTGILGGPFMGGFAKLSPEGTLIATVANNMTHIYGIPLPGETPHLLLPGGVPSYYIYIYDKPGTEGKPVGRTKGTVFAVARTPDNTYVYIISQHDRPAGWVRAGFPYAQFAMPIDGLPTSPPDWLNSLAPIEPILASNR